MTNTRYATNTINASNPFARYAHRTRVKVSLSLTHELLAPGATLLDYGCGDGHFLRELLLAEGAVRAVGYEPYLTQRVDESLPIVTSLSDIQRPLDLITIFEVIEHLPDDDFREFLDFAHDAVAPHGKVIASMPIEVGPVLLLKESRRLASRRAMEYGGLELAKAALLAIPGQRASNRLGSHKGFDFRSALRFIEERGFRLVATRFSPFPRLGFYGNSQVFVVFERALARPV